MMNLSSHGTQDLYPTFLKRYRGFGVDDVANLAAISMVGAIIGGMVFGQLSDRIGRRIAMTIAFVGALAAIPLWALPSAQLSWPLGHSYCNSWCRGRGG